MNGDMHTNTAEWSLASSAKRHLEHSRCIYTRRIQSNLKLCLSVTRLLLRSLFKFELMRGGNAKMAMVKKGYLQINKSIFYFKTLSMVQRTMQETTWLSKNLTIIIKICMHIYIILKIMQILKKRGKKIVGQITLFNYSLKYKAPFPWQES